VPDTRVAIVTGAAGGLGAAVAGLLAESGHHLALVDSRREELESTAKRLRVSGSTVKVLATDLSDWSKCNRVVPEVVEQFGRVDILVNSAAILLRQAMEEVTAADFDQVFYTNTRSVFLLSRAAISDMETRGWGRIVNVTSTGVYEGGFTMSSAMYESSKGAVAVLTKMFAKHGAPNGILVNTVCPGGMRTRMLLEQTSADLVRRAEQELIPLRRLADPIEVAQMIAWLVSDRASYATGAEFDITGGIALH